MQPANSSRCAQTIKVDYTMTQNEDLLRNRFIELASLLKDFLNGIYEEPELICEISCQLENVLKNCDSISYNERGASEAYAIVHFLDRFHRFQLIYRALDEQKIMPMPKRKIDILDVGTGPGPSMFALSDFYKNKIEELNIENMSFNIDYVERSESFRNWLHHFTEYVNAYTLSKKKWDVPYHHGSFLDFKDLEFNQSQAHFNDWGDGRTYVKYYVKKYRFDLIIFSNFLTTKEQVNNFSEEIIKCMQFLRNKGRFIVVGARSSSEKYKEVYDAISEILLKENFNNWKFVAGCRKTKINPHIFSYSWSDVYGTELKSVIRQFNEKIQLIKDNPISSDIKKKLDRTIEPSYDKNIEWEVHIFTKYAKPRDRSKKRT